MIPAKVIVIVAVVAAVLSTAFAVASQSFIAFFATAQDDKLIKNTVGGHTAGYGLYETSGDVLDPEHSHNTASEKVIIDPDKYLRSFNYGRISKLADGSTVREFTLVADDRQTMEISPGVFYNVWAFNGTVPGPTLRATEGDLIRINFINNGTKPHSIHTHGIHKAEMDGVFETINPKGKFTYEFYAEAFGVYPYHCHVTPLEEHISHGLYGVYIVDPKTPRPQADEMVMIMNGFDTDFDAENNFYAVNTIPFYYMHHPIEIQKDKLVRVYLVNMLEFDQINNFHLHGNLYHLYRSGTSMTPDEYTDMVTMSQGERGILEFSYKYPGQYMFHAHKTEFAEKGWVGLFMVKDPAQTLSNNSNSSSSRLLETKAISGGVGT
ncbi:MAG TPA: multicopper oxidase domain-containing protein [Nitrososphaera sp.]